MLPPVVILPEYEKWLIELSECRHSNNMTLDKLKRSYTHHSTSESAYDIKLAEQEQKQIEFIEHGIFREDLEMEETMIIDVMRDIVWDSYLKVCNITHINPYDKNNKSIYHNLVHVYKCGLLNIVRKEEDSSILYENTLVQK